MFLRMYNTSDCEYLAELFYQIVHNVNAKDYTKEQLDVWPIVCEIFCDINPYMFRYAYSRMTSYWNEFYRKDSYRIHDYVGYKLYKQCFGYSRRFDKLN